MSMKGHLVMRIEKQNHCRYHISYHAILLYSKNTVTQPGAVLDILSMPDSCALGSDSVGISVASTHLDQLE